MKEAIIETVKFTDVVKDITGGNRKFSTDEYLQDGKLPIIDQGQNLIGGYTNELSRVKRNKPVVVFGDHTKTLKYVDFDFCLGADGVKILEPTDQIDTAFLYYYLSTQKLPEVGYSRHFKFLKEIEIPLFPLSAQKKAIAILDKADALRKKDKQLLQYYDDLAQSLFIDLFGDPVRNKKGWETRLLNEVAHFKGGGTPTTSNKKYYNGHISWISPKDMKSTFVSNSIDKITELALKESSTKLIDTNSVLMVVRSGILKHTLPLAINTVPVAINQDMKALLPKKNVNSIFLMYDILIQSNLILKTVRGTTADNLSSDVIKSIAILLPPIALQNHFAAQIQNIEQQKEKLKAQIQESENLFQALLQKAFNGSLN